jgi:hypothetical protein
MASSRASSAPTGNRVIDKIPVGAELARDGGSKITATQKPYRYSLTVFKFQFLYL